MRKTYLGVSYATIRIIKVLVRVYALYEVRVDYYNNINNSHMNV